MLVLLFIGAIFHVLLVYVGMMYGNSSVCTDTGKQASEAGSNTADSQPKDRL